MNLRDIDQSVQAAIDNAFAAGEWRGKQQADEHVMAECVALRVELAKRDRFQCVVMHVFVAVTVVACWGSVVLAVAWVAS